MKSPRGILFDKRRPLNYRLSWISAGWMACFKLISAEAPIRENTVILDSMASLLKFYTNKLFWIYSNFFPYVWNKLDFTQSIIWQNKLQVQLCEHHRRIGELGGLAAYSNGVIYKLTGENSAFWCIIMIKRIYVRLAYIDASPSQCGCCDHQRHESMLQKFEEF